MSVGHHDVEPMAVGTVVKLLQRYAGLRAQVASPIIIVRRYVVPYVAGKSADGAVTYISENVPERFPRSGIEPDRYYNFHENGEFWFMTRQGRDYLGFAHPFGRGIERMHLKMDGYPDDVIDEYERESEEAMAQAIGMSTPETVPPDLYEGPYREDPDAADRRLLPILQAARARALPVRAAG